MTRIWGIPHNRRAKKFKGLVRFQRMKGGGMTAASWPKKGWRDKSPDGRARANLFGQVQHWTTRPFAWEQLDALEASIGTPYLARDLLAKSAYGKLTEIHFKDGRVVWPQKLMSSEIQAQLDTITTQPGSLLIRTAKEWVGFPVGPTGNVLTSQGPAVLPRWLPPAGGGVSTLYSSTPHDGTGTITSSDNFALCINPIIPMTFSRIWMRSRTAGERTVQATLYVIEDGTVGEIIAQTAMQPLLSTDDTWFGVELAATFIVTAPQSYAIGVSQYVDDEPQRVALERTDTSPAGMPSTSFQRSAQTESPVAQGSAVNIISGQCPQCIVEWKPS